MSVKLRDHEVRRALHAKVLADHHGDPETLVVDELGLWYGTARVDVAVINGRMHGLEIKSDLDTLDRLPAQIETYNRVLDRVTIVVGERRADVIHAHVPAWWGIKVYSVGPRGGVHFTETRAPSINRTLDAVAIAAMLWRNELLEELEARGLARGFKSRGRDAVSRKLAESVGLTELRDLVRARLKRRDGWRADARRM